MINPITFSLREIDDSAQLWCFTFPNPAEWKVFPSLYMLRVQRSKSDIARLWADVSISISLMSSLFAKRENIKRAKDWISFSSISCSHERDGWLWSWVWSFDRSCSEEKIQSESQLNCFNCWFTVPSSTEDAIEKKAARKTAQRKF